MITSLRRLTGLPVTKGVLCLKNLRRNFERFCYRHQRKGIPNLMLFVAVGNLIVYFFSLADETNLLYSLLYFDRTAILHGQVWRLFSYIFTYLLDAHGLNVILGVISLVCYYFIGKNLEQHWGTFRFNLYYLCGIVLMDIAALLIGCSATTVYLNTSLFLALATVMPDIRFLLFYIIPIKAKYLAWFDILLTLWSIVTTLLQLIGLGMLNLRMLLYCLFPLIALGNYFLFFGKDVLNVIPMSWRANARRLFRKNPGKQKPKIIEFNAGSYEASKASPKAPYTHRCTVCGRTDVSNPELEFRYCSRCKGYYCYCQDHINNHSHIQ